MENANAALDVSPQRTTSIQKIEIRIQAFPLTWLKKFLIFIEQQKNIEFKTKGLKTINQIELHHLSSLKHLSVTCFLSL